MVRETVYENRFGFTKALNEMGANIVVHEHGFDSDEWRVPKRPLEQVAIITGPTKLHGSDVEVPDLRGGFSYLIAALAAEGTSTVTNIGIISRGYELFVEKLEALGADFTLEG
jgi:UDP-N-acetylglucosamine 1-carboxyvinyltransferase